MLKNIKFICVSILVSIALTSCATSVPLTTEYPIKTINTQAYSDIDEYHYLMAFLNLYNNKIPQGIKEYELFLQNHQEKKFYLEFINILVRVKDFNRAQEFLKIAIKKYPNDSEFYLLLSDIYVMQNKYYNAINVLQQSHLKSFDVYKNIALLYAQIGDINNAINTLIQAREFSNKGEVYFYVSQIYYNFGLEENALEYAKMAANYKYPKAYIALGDMYLKKNYSSKAISYYEDFLKLPNQSKEDEVYVYTNLASIYYTNNRDLNKATYYYKKAYNIDKSELNLERLTYLLLENKDFKSVKNLLQENPITQHSSTLRYFLGIAYFGLKDYEESVKQFSDVNFASNVYIDAISKKALSLYELGKKEQSIQTLEETLKLNPNEKLYTTLFYIYSKDKDWDNLIKAIKNSENVTKDKSKLYFYLADIYYDKKHDVRKAIHYLDEALRVNPNDPEVLNYLGYLYIDENIDVKAGIMLVKEALKQKPSNPYYLDSLGWGYYKEEKYLLALKYLKEANRLLKKPENTIVLHLAQIYKKLGYSSKARSIALDVLKQDKNNKVAKDLLK